MQVTELKLQVSNMRIHSLILLLLSVHVGRYVKQIIISIIITTIHYFVIRNNNYSF